MSTVRSDTRPRGEEFVYETENGEVRLDVRLDQDTVWLTQWQMADLFGRDRSVLTRHIQNAFREGERDPKATSAKHAQIQSQGSGAVSIDVDHFNRDVIMSVEYRVRSRQVTRLRHCATQALLEHLVRGFTVR